MYMYTSNIVGTTVLCVGYAGKGVKVRAFTESSIKRKRVSASKIGGGGAYVTQHKAQGHGDSVHSYSRKT